MPKHNFLAGGLKKSYDYYDLTNNASAVKISGWFLVLFVDI